MTNTLATHNRLLVCIFSMGIASCGIFGNKADIARTLDNGFFIAQEAIDPVAVPTSQEGKFEEADAQRIIRSMKPIVFTSMPGATPSINKVDFPINPVATPDKCASFTSRSYYALGASFNRTAMLGVALATEYEFLLEVQLMPSNPQYKIDYYVDPHDLIEVQLASQEHGASTVLFASHIFAPEVLFFHKLLSKSLKAEIPVFFTSKGSLISNYMVTLGRRLVLRQYSDPETVSTLCAEGTPMFEEVAQPANDSGDPGMCVTEHLKKCYRCTPQYVNHLRAENVHFRVPPVGSMSSFSPSWADFIPLKLDLFSKLQ